MKRRVFGFDLGIASVGWAVLEFDKEYFDQETGEIFEDFQPELQELAQGKILGCGVRCFAEAETPKTGAPLGAARREKRLARRTCRRKARRMAEIKELFVKQGLVGFEGNEAFRKFYECQEGGDVWDLRVKALSEELMPAELVRVLTHLAKHRGFKSSRKAAEEQDKESGRLLEAIKNNMAQLEQGKTLAQIIVERAKTSESKKLRNYSAAVKSGKEPEPQYVNSIPRSEIRRELDMIFSFQKQFGIFTQELYDRYSAIAFRQRGIQGIGKMLGNCTFEKGEKRAPKQAPAAELFVALGKINNLAVYENEQKRFLTREEREKLLELLQTTKTVKFKTIASKIFKGREIQFAQLDYSRTAKNGTEKADPEDTVFYEMKGWHALKKALGGLWEEARKDTALLDRAVTVIATEKEDGAIREKLRELMLSEEYIQCLLPLSFDTFINLSLKALYNINPYMLEGLKYHEACEKAGYDFRETADRLCETKGKFLPAIPQDKQTTVPVVNRTVAQFRKVYNAMVRRFGEPDQINIETGRELKKTFNERNNIKKQQKANYEKNQWAVKELEERGVTANGTNILKLRLYKEQECKCLYSRKPLDLERLFEEGYAEIDHILPYSRSMDNSYFNKVLVLSEENRKKTNQTPFEYLAKSDPNSKEWEEYRIFVQSFHAVPRKKKENLLTETFKEREQGFRERNANDNSYIAVYVKRYLTDAVDFSRSAWQNKNKIQMCGGSVTAYLRHRWGLTKDREESDKHHAQDAVVIACANQGMVQALSNMSKYRGNINYVKNRDRYFVAAPWEGFRKDVLAALDSVFVSRAVRKNVTGELHEETIRTLNPCHKNYKASEVKSGIKVRGGLANNGEMLRTDVFSKKNKKGKEEFYLVPVYKHSLGRELPKKAIVSNKPESEWIVMDETYTFRFSLFLDDLIKTQKNGTEFFGYFRGTDRATGAITVLAHDKSWTQRGIGIKTQDSFVKYQVDPLGVYAQVREEKRLPLNLMKTKKKRG